MSFFTGLWSDFDLEDSDAAFGRSALLVSDFTFFSFTDTGSLESLEFSENSTGLRLLSLADADFPVFPGFSEIKYKYNEIRYALNKHFTNVIHES